MTVVLMNNRVLTLATACPIEAFKTHSCSIKNNECTECQRVIIFLPVIETEVNNPTKINDLNLCCTLAQTGMCRKIFYYNSGAIIVVTLNIIN